MDEITTTEYQQEMKNHFRCVILDTKCIYSSCVFCDIGIAFRKGIEWERKGVNRKK